MPHPLLDELFAPEEPVYSADGMIPDEGPTYDLSGIPSMFTPQGPPLSAFQPSPRSRMYIGRGGGPVDEFGFPLMDDGTVTPNNTFRANGQTVPPLGPLDTVPQWVRDKMIADEKLRAERQYASEIDSANRFYGRPEEYGPEGQLLPPPGRGRIPAMPQPRTLQFMRTPEGGAVGLDRLTGESKEVIPGKVPKPSEDKPTELQTVRKRAAAARLLKAYAEDKKAYTPNEKIKAQAEVAAAEKAVSDLEGHVIPPIVGEQTLGAPAPSENAAKAKKLAEQFKASSAKMTPENLKKAEARFAELLKNLGYTPSL